MHPRRSERAAAAEQRKCITHRQEYTPPIPRLIVDDPSFHPHAGQRHPYEVRIGAIDGVGEQGLISLRQGPKRRAKHADNFDIRLQLDQHASQLDEALLEITEKEMTPWPRRVPQRVSHEVRTIYPVLQAGAAKVERPDDRHPVRQHQVEAGQNTCKLRTVPGLAKNVGVGGTDRGGPRFMRERLDALQREIVRGTCNRGS